MFRNKSTISREIKRNKNRNTNIYDANLAENKKYNRKKKACKKERLLNSKTRRLVAEYIQEGHSPRTTASILEERHCIKTNYESIYQWIYKERQDLIEFLSQKHRKRLKRGYKKQPRATKLCNRRDIIQSEQK